MKTRSLRWTTLAAALVLAGCAALPQPAAEALPVTPAMFKEAEGTRWTEAAPAEAQPRGQWWRAFGDPVLDDLVARADERNAGIAVAALAFGLFLFLDGVTVFPEPFEQTRVGTLSDPIHERHAGRDTGVLLVRRVNLRQTDRPLTQP